MEEVMAGYRRLLQLLEEERESARRCMDGDYLRAYLSVIEQEEENLKRELRLLSNNIN
jgi:hypothetical protein